MKNKKLFIWSVVIITIIIAMTGCSNAEESRVLKETIIEKDILVPEEESTSKEEEQSVETVAEDSSESAGLIGEIENGKIVKEEVEMGDSDPISQEDSQTVQEEDIFSYEEIKTWSVRGDYSLITEENLQGTWYDEEMGETLIIDGGGCRVIIPFLDLDGSQVYEYEIVDRSDRGLCPQLSIYFNGKENGPLAYYISGVQDNCFWGNTQQQMFEKQ